MTSKARYTSRYARAAPAVLMPPNLQNMGSLPFTPKSFAELDAWLAEEGWPPGHMDAAMLEGYLVALLVWPIELSAGAWLPPIWGIRGWKVAAKIATTAKCEPTILVDGWAMKIASASLSKGTSAKTSGANVPASAA